MGTSRNCLERICDIVHHCIQSRQLRIMVRCCWRLTERSIEIQVFGNGMRWVIGLVEVLRKNDCDELYNQCEAEGISKMQCPLAEGQVAQPINILVLIDASQDTQVCDIHIDLRWSVIAMPGLPAFIFCTYAVIMCERVFLFWLE